MRSSTSRSYRTVAAALVLLTAQPLAVAAQESQQATALSTAAGFRMGWTSGQVAHACRSEGFEYTQLSSEVGLCAGAPEDYGMAGAHARMEFCGDRLCMVMLLAAPRDRNAGRVYRRIERVLVRRLEGSHFQSLAIADGLLGEFEVQTGRLWVRTRSRTGDDIEQVRFGWLRPEVLGLSVDPGRRSIVISFYSVSRSDDEARGRFDGPPPPPPDPIELAGFRFDMTPSEARRTCVAAGSTWVPPEHRGGSYACSGPLPREIGVPVDLMVLDVRSGGRLGAITALGWPRDLSAALIRLVEVERHLARRYGSPVRSPVVEGVSSSCRLALEEALQAARGVMPFHLPCASVSRNAVVVVGWTTQSGFDINAGILWNQEGQPYVFVRYVHPEFPTPRSASGLSL